MNHLKQYCFPVIFFLLLPSACKKAKIIEAAKLDEEEPNGEQLLIPIKLESGSLTIHLKYKENTGLITEVEEVAGVKTVITYSKEAYPSKLEKYRNGKLFYVVYYESNDKKTINKGVIFDYDDLLRNYVPKGFYQLGYDEQQRLRSIKYYNNAANAELVKEFSRSYAPSSSLLEIQKQDYPAPIKTVAYNWDQKKGICGNVGYTDLLALEMEHWFLTCKDNNILNGNNQQLPVENIGFNYIYNEASYPSSMNISKAGQSQSFKITYQLLKND